MIAKKGTIVCAGATSGPQPAFLPVRLMPTNAKFVCPGYVRVLLALPAPSPFAYQGGRLSGRLVRGWRVYCRPLPARRGGRAPGSYTWRVRLHAGGCARCAGGARGRTDSWEAAHQDCVEALSAPLPSRGAELVLRRVRHRSIIDVQIVTGGAASVRLSHAATHSKDSSAKFSEDSTFRYLVSSTTTTDSLTRASV